MSDGIEIDSSMTEQDLLDAAQRGVERAQALGADQTEVCVDWGRETRVDLQKDDILNASMSNESTFGIRVFKNDAVGFATVNDPTAIELACEEALALAKVSPPDEGNGLREAAPVTALDSKPDPAIAAIDISQLVDLGAALLERIKKKDPRVVTDSGHIYSVVSRRALATSTGIALSDAKSVCGGSLFGMAVTPEEVGSFDYDGQVLVNAAALQGELEAAADRYVIKTLGALGAGKGESFRGPVILVPEVVSDFLVDNLLTVLNGQAVRTGKSPFADKLNHEIASPTLTLIDDARQDGGVASRAFDREGTPTHRQAIVEHGTLKTFLYDVYEARAAGTEPTGHARGGASAPPSVGPSNLLLESGDLSFTRMCCDPDRAVVVSRFSGSCNPITGEFSGVVKGGFLMKRGDKSPIKETLIAGNLFDALTNVSGVSAESRVISGARVMPSIRVEDVSITAG